VSRPHLTFWTSSSLNPARSSRTDTQGKTQHHDQDQRSNSMTLNRQKTLRCRTAGRHSEGAQSTANSFGIRCCHAGCHRDFPCPTYSSAARPCDHRPSMLQSRKSITSRRDNSGSQRSSRWTARPQLWRPAFDKRQSVLSVERHAVAALVLVVMLGLPCVSVGSIVPGSTRTKSKGKCGSTRTSTEISHATWTSHAHEIDGRGFTGLPPTVGIVELVVPSRVRSNLQSASPNVVFGALTARCDFCACGGAF